MCLIFVVIKKYVHVQKVPSYQNIFMICFFTFTFTVNRYFHLIMHV